VKAAIEAGNDPVRDTQQKDQLQPDADWLAARPHALLRQILVD